MFYYCNSVRMTCSIKRLLILSNHSGHPATRNRALPIEYFLHRRRNIRVLIIIKLFSNSKPMYGSYVPEQEVQRILQIFLRNRPLFSAEKYFRGEFGFRGRWPPALRDLQWRLYTKISKYNLENITASMEECRCKTKKIVQILLSNLFF